MGEHRSVAATGSSAGPYPGGWIGYDRLSGASRVTADEQTVMELTVAVPEDRAVRVLWHGLVTATAPLARTRVRIKEGDALLQARERACPVPGAPEEITAVVHLTPTAGEHVYTVTLEAASGEGEVQVLADPACPAELIIEDVGPAPV